MLLRQSLFQSVVDRLAEETLAETGPGDDIPAIDDRPMAAPAGAAFAAAFVAATPEVDPPPHSAGDYGIDPVAADDGDAYSSQTLHAGPMAGLNEIHVQSRPSGPNDTIWQAPYLEMVGFAPPETVVPEPTPPEPEPPPPHLLRLTLEEITEDLGLQPDDTLERLAERRRLFARENHPDRAPDGLRNQATARMTTANMLIDRALLEARLRTGST